jgi:mRNA interferase MazF
MMNYRRGDVLLLFFPNSDLKTYKKRPALLVQANGLRTGIEQRIVALITSNEGRTGPTRVLFSLRTPEARQMGLRTDSVVVTDNLATVRDRAIEKKIGSCPNMAPVDQALKTSLAL